MEVEYKRVKISDLHKDPANARLHNSENLSDIRASLKHFGQVEPLVVQKATGKVIGGNGRLDVMVELGWEECDVAYVDFDNMQATALGIALNRAGERSEWNPDVLDKLLSEIDGVSEELAASLKELEKEVGIDEEPAGDADAEPQIDKAAELQKKWGTATGQLWLIGEHRLLCGDSTKREDVERVMDGEKAGLMVTDPPYGVGYEYDSHDDSSEKGYWDLINGFMKLRPESPSLVTVGHKHNNQWFKRFDPHSFLVWFDNTKQSPHKVAYMCKSELILVFGKLSNRYAWDTFEVNGVRGDGLRELHTCPKPVELFQKLIEPQTDAIIIYEPFSGSGTTFVAAQNLKRKCYGIEISPAYCAVILERMKTAFPTLEIRLAE